MVTHLNGNSMLIFFKIRFYHISFISTCSKVTGEEIRHSICIYLHTIYMIVFPYNSLLNMVMPCMQCHLDLRMFTIQSHSLLAGDHWESFTSDSLMSEN